MIKCKKLQSQDLNPSLEVQTSALSPTPCYGISISAATHQNGKEILQKVKAPSKDFKYKIQVLRIIHTNNEVKSEK